MNLILLEREEVSDDGRTVLSGGRAAHLRNVLKATPGQPVRVGIVDGPLGIGTVESCETDGRVLLRCGFESDVPAVPRVDLLLALPRPKVMRRLWAQIAAIGVGRVIITNAARVERDYFDAHVLEPAQYRPLLVEGLQQARDTRLPRVSVHRQFRILVEDHLDALSGDSVRLVAHPHATRSAAVAARESHASARVLLAVGPEGGWNAFELSLLEAHRFQPVGLGPRTLRTDTACIALLSLVHDALFSIWKS